eukprot:1866497-Lingulodinium_polyedra.AAC.1
MGRFLPRHPRAAPLPAPGAAGRHPPLRRPRSPLAPTVLLGVPPHRAAKRPAPGWMLLRFAVGHRALPMVG